MARVRFGLAMGLTAVILGTLFAHTLAALMAPLIGALRH